MEGELQEGGEVRRKRGGRERRKGGGSVREFGMGDEKWERWARVQKKKSANF